MALTKNQKQFLEEMTAKVEEARSMGFAEWCVKDMCKVLGNVSEADVADFFASHPQALERAEEKYGKLNAGIITVNTDMVNRTVNSLERRGVITMVDAFGHDGMYFFDYTINA